MPASPNFSIPAKVISAIKLAGSNRVKLCIAVDPTVAGHGHAVLAFEKDSASIGDAYVGLAAGTACTLSLTIP